jgi:putative lipoic acid-binding regulatory protein
LDTIGNIRGVTYRNIGDDGFGTGSKMMGVIAQELEPYLPEIVSTDGDGYKSVKYGNLTALLIQAVKEQQEQIEELKEEIKEIKDG